MDVNSRQSPHPQPRTREERRSLSEFTESLADGTSKFFSSVIAKKNGLISDLSKQIETTFASKDMSMDSGSGKRGSVDTTGQQESMDYGEKGSVDYGSKGSMDYGSKGRMDYSKRESMDYNRGSMDQGMRGSLDYGRDGTPPGTPPPRPPPPRKPPSVQEMREKEKIIKRMASMPAYSRTDTAGSDASGRPVDRQLSMNGMNISFDEPLYNRNSVQSTEKVGEESVQDTSNQHFFPSDQQYSGDVQNVERNMNEMTVNERNKVVKEQESKKQEINKMPPSPPEVNQIKPSAPEATTDANKRAPKFTTTKRRSSTVDEMLFDDYVEPEVEADTVFSAENLPPDLMSFEQEADTAAKKKSPRPSQSSVNSTGESKPNLYASTSVESSDVEYGGESVPRSASKDSEKSWTSTYSIDSQPDDITLECMEFMKKFVEKVFSADDEMSQMEKAKYGELCQYAPGRLWFARYVNSQRVNNKRVPEQIFFRLVQYLAVCLFECNEAEDFSPAKTLMNMCFTFYCDMQGPSGDKSFLYMFLRDQPIWQSLRFWNAAFFDAVQCERSRRPMPTNGAANDTMTDDRNFQENITFGQLGTFACNMRAFGLSRELCVEFLRKQSTIANLSEEQVKLLRENIDKMRDS